MAELVGRSLLEALGDSIKFGSENIVEGAEVAARDSLESMTKNLQDAGNFFKDVEYARNLNGSVNFTFGDFTKVLTEDEFKSVTRALGEGDVTKALKESFADEAKFNEKIALNADYFDFLKNSEKIYKDVWGRTSKVLNELVSEVSVKNELKPLEDAGLEFEKTLTDEQKKTFNDLAEKSRNGKLTKTELEEATETLTDGQKKALEEMRQTKLFNDLAEKIKNGVKEGGKWTVSDYVKLGVGVALAASALAFSIWIYTLIKNHQHAMNGCWYVDKNGNKRKVVDWSCNKGDASRTISGQSANSKNIKDADKNTGECNCDQATDKGSSGSCSPCCNCDMSQCTDGKFQCVKANPAQAAADLAAEIPGGIGDFLGKIGKVILKVLLIAALVLIGVFIVFFLFKLILHYATNRKTQPTGQAQTTQSKPSTRGTSAGQGISKTRSTGGKQGGRGKAKFTFTRR